MRTLSKCRRDGLYKSRPSSECTYCGISPVETGGDAYTYDRSVGFADMAYNEPPPRGKTRNG